MTPQTAVFLVLAAVAVAGALNLILQRHPIHSALSLILVMVSLAGLYLLMGAEFVAAVSTDDILMEYVMGVRGGLRQLNWRTR